MRRILLCIIVAMLCIIKIHAVEIICDKKMRDELSVLLTEVTENIEKCDNIDNTERRMEILRFLEHLITAYYNKDIDFIKNAMIVTNESKKHIETLKRVFARNETINVNIAFLDEECAISQSDNKSNVYGVRLKLKWITQNYCDEGFVLFVFEFDDGNKPKTRFVTWQSIMNNKISSKDDVITLRDLEGMLQ